MQRHPLTCANEGIERRRRAKIDTANDEHDGKVEEKGGHRDLLLLVNFTEPATTEQRIVAGERPCETGCRLVCRIQGEDSREEQKNEEYSCCSIRSSGLTPDLEHRNALHCQQSSTQKQDRTTHPVAVVTTASISLVQYIIMAAKTKDVTNPIDTVLINALGTTTPGFLHSSARCTAPSIPAYM